MEQSVLLSTEIADCFPHIKLEENLRQRDQRARGTHNREEEHLAISMYTSTRRSIYYQL